MSGKGSFAGSAGVEHIPLQHPQQKQQNVLLGQPWVWLKENLRHANVVRERPLGNTRGVVTLYYSVIDLLHGSSLLLEES